MSETILAIRKKLSRIKSQCMKRSRDQPAHEIAQAENYIGQEQSKKKNDHLNVQQKEYEYEEEYSNDRGTSS